MPSLNDIVVYLLLLSFLLGVIGTLNLMYWAWLSKAPIETVNFRCNKAKNLIITAFVLCSVFLITLIIT